MLAKQEREREREAQKESDKQHKKGGGKPTRQYDIHRLRVSEYSTHTHQKATVEVFLTVPRGVGTALTMGS